jgi:ribonuclease P protein component
VFYLYRLRIISSKDLGGGTTRGRIRRDTPAAPRRFEGSMKAKILVVVVVVDVIQVF